MPAARPKNWSCWPACTKYAAPITTTHTARLSMIVRLAPSRRATMPCSTPPMNATNCTMRIVTVSTVVSKCSSSEPYCADTLATVAMPSV
jgi:hypothetical protein